MLLRIATAIALASVAACTGGAQSTGIDPVTCSQESTLTYDNFGKDVIETNCLGCHDKQSPRLTTVDAIRAHKAAILDEAVYTDAMPQSAGMPLQQRELLNEWLACGAP